MVTNSHAISDIDSSLDAWAPTHWAWLYDTVLPQGCSIDISSSVGAQTCNPPVTVAKTKLTHSDCICQKLCFVKFMLLYCCLTVFFPPHILKKGVICRIFRNFLMCSQNILPKYVQKPNLKCIKQIWNSSNPSKNGPKLINITKIIIIIQQIIKNPSTHQKAHQKPRAPNRCGSAPNTRRAPPADATGRAAPRCGGVPRRGGYGAPPAEMSEGSVFYQRFHDDLVGKIPI